MIYSCIDTSTVRIGWADMILERGRATIALPTFPAAGRVGRFNWLHVARVRVRDEHRRCYTWYTEADTPENHTNKATVEDQASELYRFG